MNNKDSMNHLLRLSLQCTPAYSLDWLTIEICLTVSERTIRVRLLPWAVTVAISNGMTHAFFFSRFFIALGVHIHCLHTPRFLTSSSELVWR